jgi:hypothetical protein
MGDDIPKWPGYNVPVVQISGGVTAHLAGAAVFALVGFRKMTPLWVIALFATVMASASSRGGMLAFVLPVIIAALVLGKLRALTAVLVAGVLIFAAIFAVETEFTEFREATSNRSPPRADEWAGLFLFIGCYASSFMINATFDVALEGPMQGMVLVPDRLRHRIGDDLSLSAEFLIIGG